MKNVITKGLVILAFLFLSFCSQKVYSVYCPTESTSNYLTNQSDLHQLWTINELSDSLSTFPIKKELIFMRKKSMQGTYIELDKEKSFNRKADNDDLYYLHTGTCTVYHDNRKKSFKPGDIIYVKKGSELIIEKSDEALQLVIISMFLSSNSAKPKWRHFSKESMESARNSDENTWNPFIMFSNVMLGLYMLPHSLHGDQRLVHEWQELNIVTSGNSKFIMDSGTIEVAKGSIFFVEEGNGHYFEELEDDIDILILWEMRNVDHSKH